MIYPVYVHPGDATHAHGVTIPDFTGCFAATDNWEDLSKAVQESIEVYCEGEDMVLPKPSFIETLLHDSNYVDGVWLMIDVDVSNLPSKVVKINLTIPESTLYQIDKAAKKAGVSRSSFMADAALKRAG